MLISKNIIISGAAGKPIGLDIFYSGATIKKPVVIYAHGFNGFKDWGCADLVASQFVVAGFVFVKFNFSHNGTTPLTPEEFTDLETFGQNNYTKQLEDLNTVINWVCDNKNIHNFAIDTEKVYLIGHSMGGGISILHSAKDKRIKKLITWASVSECKTPWTSWSQQKLDEWKSTGVQYYTNGRTKQQMPLYYQLYEDYVQNESILHIENSIKKLTIPLLICHGTLDNAVSIEKAYDLQNWQPTSILFTIASDHVFGRTHPCNNNKLPAEMSAVIEKSVSFLLSS
jgi:uncharacterized protein